ncbi:MAG: putative membrane protein YedE/YeeE [Bermanella sp.]|jgi:uncharacterized membrane protein YedE/YeeE
MQKIVALLAGILFGAGLAASDMNNPERVQGFLDLLNWDPSLMFVMIGALAVALPCFQILMKKQGKPLFTKRFSLPTKVNIDKQLIIGASLFGMGWAIVGYCPGPAIAALGYGYGDVFVFVAAMLVGAKAQQLLPTKAA